MVCLSLQRGVLAVLACACFVAPGQAQDVTIAVTDNPCFIAAGSDQCSTVLSWDTPSDPTRRVAIRSVGVDQNVLWACPLAGPGSIHYSGVRPRAKTLEVYLVGVDDCDHQTPEEEAAFFGAREPEARVAVVGVRKQIIAEQQQCIARGGSNKCNVPLRWSPAPLPAGRDTLQIRFRTVGESLSTERTWRCLHPLPGSEEFPFATQNGRLIRLVAANGCHEDPDVDELDTLQVRAIAEIKGVYFTPNLVATALPDPTPPAGATYTLTADASSYAATNWPRLLLEGDADVRASIDRQLRDELAAVAGAGAGFNLIFVQNRDLVPWPDTENGETVEAIRPAIEGAVDKLVHLVELADQQGLSTAFNIQHYCQVPTSVTVDDHGMPLDPNWAHQGGSCIDPSQNPATCERYPACSDNNVEIALEWYEVMFDRFEAELTARGLVNRLAYVNPVARFRLGEGGDLAAAWTERNPYIEHTRAYLREVYPALQQMTDIPLSPGMSLMTFLDDEDARYEPVDDLWAVLPHYLADFIYVTSYFESRKFMPDPIAIDPVRVLEGFGGPPAKVQLTDWQFDQIADHAACSGLDEPELDRCLAARAFTICRADCSVVFFDALVPPPKGSTVAGGQGLGLAGTWVLGYRSAYAERLANATSTEQQNRYRRKLPAIGLRARNCLQDFNPSTQGFDVACTFNDPGDWLVRDAFQAPLCPSPEMCVMP